MKINEMVKQVHDMAVERGWWEKPRNPLELQMLIVSEIAEACECARTGEPDLHYGEVVDVSLKHILHKSDSLILTKDGRSYLKEGLIDHNKPEGESVELADAVIRIMDYFGHKGWDLEKILEEKIRYNASRPYRHGGKKF